jgi:hypothetical protein
MMKWMFVVILGTGLGLMVAGCSQHNDYPLTPVMYDTTPTYRSTVRSTDLHVEPFYTQPGVNSGPPAPLPEIPSQDRWDPNDPLATEVYNALTNDQGAQPKYLRVYAHKGQIWLQGTVLSHDQAVRAAMIAKNFTGVRTVRNDLHVSL